MRKPLKVYHGRYHRRMNHGSTQVEVIVSAESGAQARRILDVVGIRVGLGDWRNFWGTTENAVTVPVSLASPGEVLWQPPLPGPTRRGVWIPWSWEWQA